MPHRAVSQFLGCFYQYHYHAFLMQHYYCHIRIFCTWGHWNEQILYLVETEVNFECTVLYTWYIRAHYSKSIATRIASHHWKKSEILFFLTGWCLALQIRAVRHCCCGSGQNCMVCMVQRSYTIDEKANFELMYQWYITHTKQCQFTTTELPISSVRHIQKRNLTTI